MVEDERSDVVDGWCKWMDWEKQVVAGNVGISSLSKKSLIQATVTENALVNIIHLFAMETPTFSTRFCFGENKLGEH